VSLNIPITHLGFRRSDVEYFVNGSGQVQAQNITETGSETGLGDVALIGRFTVLEKRGMTSGFQVNLLGGVKFPTGDASRVAHEVAQSRLFESFLPPGTPHDPLGHSFSSVHEDMLALGSGSYDGVFGLTANARWRRLFLNGQFQYYLRTHGEADFKYGDEIIVSGGPGGYLLLNPAFTLSLQANAVYDTMARDELLGRPSDRTGSTGWYLGPSLYFTWGEHFSANAGIELPLRIANNFFQSVPDYRLHGAISVRF
jgi:hypothetical protein